MNTRDRLLAATIEVFRGKGYQGTSLAEIASTAEATIGSLYHFFPGGKGALAAEALYSSGAAYQTLFDLVVAEASNNATEAESTATEAVGAFFDGAADALEETDFIELCPIGSVAREMAGLDDAIRAAAGAVFTDWIDHLTDLLVAEDVPETDARGLAITIVASIEGSFGLARTMRDADLIRSTGTHMRRLVDTLVATERSVAHR